MSRDTDLAFVKSVVGTLMTRVAVLTAGVATGIITARCLGPDGQGIYALVMLLPTLIVALTHTGIGRSITYHTAKRIYPLANLLGTILVSTLALAIASVLVGLGTIGLLRHSCLHGVPAGLLLLSLALIPLELLYSQSLNGVLLGKHKIGLYNAGALFHSLSQLTFVIIFLVLLKGGTLAAFLAALLSLATTTAVVGVLMYRLRGGVRISLRFDRVVACLLFHYGWKVQSNSLCALLHLKIDRILLNWLLNPLAVGWYSVSVGITEGLWLLSEAVSTVLYPRLASTMDDQATRRLTPLLVRSTLALTGLAALLIAFVSRPLVVLLYSEAYRASVEPLQVLLIGVVAVSAERILSNDIFARGKPMMNTVGTFAALLANVAGNLILIPRYGILGAAWSTSLSYSLNLLLKLFIYCKLSGSSAADVMIPKKADYMLYEGLLTAGVVKVLRIHPSTPNESD
jgi:O-antigen/teichoic acid export membrane protein